MRLFALAVLLATPPLQAQPALQQQIQNLALAAHGTVSVACSLPGTALNCDLNPHTHPPMQSVFKFPLVVTVLHEVEQGKLTLDQPIRFLPQDRILPHTYSPLQDKYPNANADIPLRDLLQASVGRSDNAATEVLLRIIGGPRVVNDYIASLGVTGFHLQDGEQRLHADPKAQYNNWWEPAGAVQLLRLLADRSPLTPQDTRFLLDGMHNTNTQRIIADLPPGTYVAHKSGSSGTENGLAPATNDIGLITLLDGRRLALAIFITDSTADDATRDKTVARIARAIYDAALTAH